MNIIIRRKTITTNHFLNCNKTKETNKKTDVSIIIYFKNNIVEKTRIQTRSTASKGYINNNNKSFSKKTNKTKLKREEAKKKVGIFNHLKRIVEVPRL